MRVVKNIVHSLKIFTFVPCDKKFLLYSIHYNIDFVAYWFYIKRLSFIKRALAHVVWVIYKFLLLKLKWQKHPVRVGTECFNLY